MLITALVSFMVAFFAQSYDPMWDGIPAFMWIGIIAAALSVVGVVYALFMDKPGERPIFAHHYRHTHSHA